MDEITAVEQPDHLQLTASIVAAYVSKNSLRATDLPGLITDVHAALAGLTDAQAPVEEPAEKVTPAQIRKSITPDALISFIDGKPYKTLKRHLGTYGLDFETYRARYGLPVDYPTVSANYSAARSMLAKELGLGQQRRRGAASQLNEVEAAVAPELPAAAANAKASGRLRKKAAGAVEAA